jgi:hypothetical protein
MHYVCEKRENLREREVRQKREETNKETKKKETDR